MVLPAPSPYRTGLETGEYSTVSAKVIVEHLEEWKAVPRVGRLHLEQRVQVDGKQRPERFRVINHSVTKPRQRLHHSIPHQPVLQLPQLSSLSSTPLLSPPPSA